MVINIERLTGKKLTEKESIYTAFGWKNNLVTCCDSACSDLRGLISKCDNLTDWEKRFLRDIIFNRQLLGCFLYLTDKQFIVYSKIFKTKLLKNQL